MRIWEVAEEHPKEDKRQLTKIEDTEIPKDDFTGKFDFSEALGSD